MKVVLKTPHSNAPEKLLANVEIHELWPGKKLALRDFSIWRGPKGPFVTIPGREFTNREGEKKTAPFLFSTEEGYAATDAFKNYILAEYERWPGKRGEEPEPAEFQASDDDVPF